MEGVRLRLVDVERRCVVRAEERSVYVALSYVWGEAKRLLLSRATAERLFRPGGLAEKDEDIPKLFLDAMQDEKVDLSKHMEAMGRIYDGATLTIVSGMASADHGLPGLPGNPRTSTHCQYRVEDIALTTVGPTYAEALKKSPWESRGWTLQEKLYSKRLLIFTSSGIYFRCQNATWFEDVTLEPVIGSYTDLAVQIGEEKRPASKLGGTPESVVYEARRDWTSRGYRNLVSAYVARQLSYQADALNAFQGILAPFGPHHWGIPLRFFGQMIGWTMQSRQKFERRPELPSWSWVGWRGGTDTTISFASVPSQSSDMDVIFHRFDASAEKEWIEIKRTEPKQQDLFGTSFFGSFSAIDAGYDLPNHPGGEHFFERPFADALRIQSSLNTPGRVLRFQTSAALLDIQTPSSTNDRSTVFSGSPDQANKREDVLDETAQCSVINPTNRQFVGTVDLPKQWRNPYLGLAEFIVISRAEHMAMNSGMSRRGVRLMLIKHDGDIAYRVQMVPEIITLQQWRDAKPRWKAFNLG